MTVEARVALIVAVALAQAHNALQWFERIRETTVRSTEATVASAQPDFEIDWQDLPPPPLHIRSARMGSDYVTRVMFSNDAEIWLGPNFMDVGWRLEEMCEAREVVPIELFAALAISPDRIVKTSGPEGVRLAPPVKLDFVLLNAPRVDWTLFF